MLHPLLMAAVFAAGSPGVNSASDKKGDELVEIERSVGELRAEERNLIDDLDDLIERRRKTERDLGAAQQAERDAEKRVREKSEWIAAETARYYSLRFTLKKRSVRSYRLLRSSAVQMLLSADGPLDTLRQMSVLARLLMRDVNAFEQSLARHENLERERLLLVEGQATLAMRKDELARLQKSLRVEKDAIDSTLSLVREQRTHHERTLYDVREAEARLQHEQEEANAVADEFRSQRGQLRPPLVGEVVLPFGRRVEASYGTVTFHSGWQIQAKAGSEVQTIAAGKVLRREQRRGLGEVVVVRHSDAYCSVYAGLADVFRKAGDELPARATLGRTRNDHGLYFELRRHVTAEDPALWFVSSPLPH